ncbi:MAG: hypothetical protein FWD68_21725 [Alphaproteobacteria bacterium]|nr:hypothetical protein [Alphaproteobacteria bacterium]
MQYPANCHQSLTFDAGSCAKIQGVARHLELLEAGSLLRLGSGRRRSGGRHSSATDHLGDVGKPGHCATLLREEQEGPSPVFLQPGADIIIIIGGRANA